MVHVDVPWSSVLRYWRVTELFKIDSPNLNWKRKDQKHGDIYEVMKVRETYIKDPVLRLGFLKWCSLRAKKLLVYNDFTSLASL